MNNNNIYSKVFMWLFIGLLVTFGVGYLTLLLAYNNASFASLIFSNGSYWVIFIAEIIVAMVLGVKVYKLPGNTVKALYIGYCALTGLTFSAIFAIFNLTSIIYVFLVTSLILGAFSWLGKSLKIDLRKIGIYLLMSLIGIIILELINIFWANSALNMFACIVSIIVFMIYISYDIQKIDRLMTTNIPEENIAIMGAFNLYLDFINIFINLLKILGKNRD